MAEETVTKTPKTTVGAMPRAVVEEVFAEMPNAKQGRDNHTQQIHQMRLNIDPTTPLAGTLGIFPEGALIKSIKAYCCDDLGGITITLTASDDIAITAGDLVTTAPEGSAFTFATAADSYCKKERTITYSLSAKPAQGLAIMVCEFYSNR